MVCSLPPLPTPFLGEVPSTLFWLAASITLEGFVLRGHVCRNFSSCVALAGRFSYRGVGVAFKMAFRMGCNDMREMALTFL